MRKTIYAAPVPSKISEVEISLPGQSSITSSSELDSTTGCLKEIARILEEDDQDAYLKNLEHIEIVMQVLVRARKCAGVVFQADK